MQLYILMRPKTQSTVISIALGNLCFMKTSACQVSRYALRTNVWGILYGQFYTRMHYCMETLQICYVPPLLMHPRATETLDVFGYDYYCTIPGCSLDPYGQYGGWNVQRDGMENMIYPRFTRPTQQVVPTTLGFFYETNPFNESIMEAMDEYCRYTAEQYWEWSKQDERVAGLFPFYWPSSTGLLGLRDMPRCREMYVTIGQSIVDQAGPATLKGGGRPGVSSSCPQTKDPVEYYWCNKSL